MTDSEIAKSFIEDVEAVKDLLPKENNYDHNTKNKKGVFKMSNKTYDVLNKIQRWLPALVF